MVMMKEKGYSIPDESVYQYFEIGVDSVRLIFNKEIDVGKLTGLQMKRILTGKITNWKELRGPDIPVKVILGTKIPGTLGYVQQKLMDGEAYVPSAVEATNALDIKEKIAATQGGVGLGPASVVDIFVREQALPIPGRPIILVTKGAPSGAVKKMLGYIKGEGRQYTYK